MMRNSTIHRRRSLRLKGYDYSMAGAYFVTICTQDRACLFGDVEAGAMHLNEAGEMVAALWDDLAARFSGVEIDRFVVMPNHLLGILVLDADTGGATMAGAEAERAATKRATTRVAPTNGDPVGAPSWVPPPGWAMSLAPSNRWLRSVISMASKPRAGRQPAVGSGNATIMNTSFATRAR